MKKLKVFLIVSFALAFSTMYPVMVADAAVTCFKKGEYISGFNKICIYNCLGSDAAITIASTQLCPLTIQR